MKGKTGKVNEYNAQGSPEAKEEKNETPEFKSGGKARKDGGKAKGKAPKARLDKAGRMKRAAGGRNPISSAGSVSGGAATDTGGSKDVEGDGAYTEMGVYKSGGKAK